MCVCVKCQSHALVAITAYSAEKQLYDTLLIFDIPVNGATQCLPFHTAKSSEQEALLAAWHDG